MLNQDRKTRERQMSFQLIVNYADKTAEAIANYEREFGVDDNNDSVLIEFRDAIETFLDTED
ncbi:MAG: hypothetical protein J7525_19835 [Roseofilum sp. SID3]|uniref:hypothetical protein n=1 Tax=Roseofilum sp. SID3 TaxID=2821499 RepID=UPI001B01B873|nr:hypothetical protein [Roseofilum sp. SID3]MBP0015348.1 hypothetical protein [Roseofilum sp. SID3]